MAIEKRSGSFRAKVFQGKTLVAQKTFPTRREAEGWHRLEKARRTLEAERKRRSEEPTYCVPPGLGARLWQGYARDAEGRSYKLQDAEIRRIKLQHGIDWNPPGAEPEPETSDPDPLTRDILVRYLREICPTHRGWKQETSRLNFLIGHRIAKKRISELTRQDFVQYRETRRKQIGPDSVNRELSIWAVVIQHARDEWGVKISENPARVKRISHDNSRDRRLLPGEEERLLAAAKPILGDAIVLLIDTCMRRGELVKLRPEMLCETHLVLPKTITKTRRAREVPLTMRAREILRRRAETPGRFFDLDGSALSQRFLALCRKLQIDNLRLHDLRHEGISRLVERGRFRDIEVMKIAGHMSWKQFQRYIQVRGVDLAARLVA